MFSPAATARRSNSAISAVMTPRSANCAIETFCIRCLRIFTAQFAAVISGIATCNREPSGKRASTNGTERSNRRPLQSNNRSTRLRTCSALSNNMVSSERPFRAIKMRSGELIQISSTVGSSMKSLNGPNTFVASIVASDM